MLEPAAVQPAVERPWLRPAVVAEEAAMAEPMQPERVSLTFIDK